MRIYYKIWLTYPSNNADILSFAFCSEAGNSLYVETDDYDAFKLATSTHTKVIQSLLKVDGIKRVVPEIPKLRASICNIESARQKLGEFLEQYPYIEFVSRSSRHEIEALLWLLNWSEEERHINIINLSDKVVEKYAELKDGIREEISEYNALRYALWYKHIGLTIARKKPDTI